MDILHCILTKGNILDCKNCKTSTSFLPVSTTGVTTVETVSTTDTGTQI